MVKINRVVLFAVLITFCAAQKDNKEDVKYLENWKSNWRKFVVKISMKMPKLFVISPKVNYGTFLNLKGRSSEPSGRSSSCAIGSVPCDCASTTSTCTYATATGCTCAVTGACTYGTGTSTNTGTSTGTSSSSTTSCSNCICTTVTCPDPAIPTACLTTSTSTGRGGGERRWRRKKVSQDGIKSTSSIKYNQICFPF